MSSKTMQCLPVRINEAIIKFYVAPRKFKVQRSTTKKLISVIFFSVRQALSRNFDLCLNGYCDAIFKACCFKDLLLENVRRFIPDSINYIFPDSSKVLG